MDRDNQPLHCFVELVWATLIPDHPRYFSLWIEVAQTKLPPMVIRETGIVIDEAVEFEE